MLPVVATLKRTAGQILAYTVVLVAVTVALRRRRPHGRPLPGLGPRPRGRLPGLRRPALRQQATPRAAMRLFTYSITYLTLLFAAMAGDVLVRFH